MLENNRNLGYYCVYPKAVREAEKRKGELGCGMLAPGCDYFATGLETSNTKTGLYRNFSCPLPPMRVYAWSVKQVCKFRGCSDGFV